MTKNVPESALEAEATGHLGHEGHGRPGPGSCLDRIDELVLSLTARGFTTGELAGHFDDVYGATVSKDTISPSTSSWGSL